jgi:hypothetical protein
VPVGLGTAVATATVSPPNSFNAGNYTVTFDPNTIGIAQPVFECYHIVISGPAASSFRIYIDNNFYDNVVHGDVNSWDPNQTMKLEAGNVVHFYWSVGTGTPVPTVTMYFQEIAL